MARPYILVLAGVNGAGKSSLAGSFVQSMGMDFYNPDTEAKKYMLELGLNQEQANIKAWEFGRDALADAIRNRSDFAFETTLGGETITTLLKSAAATHEVNVIYCGLDSAEKHIARVQYRVSQGGHDIAETRIRERWQTSREHLIELMPTLTNLIVWDNSSERAAPSQTIPKPTLLLHIENSQLKYPDFSKLQVLLLVPEWAQGILQKAKELYQA